jgi:hypothetical protein
MDDRAEAMVDKLFDAVKAYIDKRLSTLPTAKDTERFVEVTNQLAAFAEQSNESAASIKRQLQRHAEHLANIERKLREL